MPHILSRLSLKLQIIRKTSPCNEHSLTPHFYIVKPGFTGVYFFLFLLQNIDCGRRDIPVGVPLDLSTPTGMSCIATYGENCKSDNVSKYRVLLVAFLLLLHEN